MSKIVVSLPLLGNNTFQIATQYADKIADEKGLDKTQISQELQQSSSFEGFKEVYEKYFGDQVIIHLGKNE